MVLFYCTFVAMKRQDQAGVPHQYLIEDEIQSMSDNYTAIEFAGVIVDSGMKHALRIITDLGSGAIRLEASALRGPMKDVPIWTAFITKYKGDPDWAELRYTRDVSLIALKPPPYVFMSGYQAMQRRGREYVMHFELANGKLLKSLIYVEAYISYRCQRLHSNLDRNLQTEELTKQILRVMIGPAITDDAFSLSSSGRNTSRSTEDSILSPAKARRTMPATAGGHEIVFGLSDSCGPASPCIHSEH